MGTQEFNSLVLNNIHGLKPFAISLTRDADKALDLYQETLCRVFASKSHYQPHTNIRAWLFTIMRNIFINEYRRAKKRKEVMNRFNNLETISHSACMPAHLREIQARIYQLPYNFKKAILLHLQGFKYHEIAFALNEPLGTIKSRIHFAKKILQNQIER